MRKIIILTLAIMTLSLMLFAQRTERPAMGKQDGDHQMMMKKSGQGPMGMEMLKELNLTEAQKAKLENLFREQAKWVNTKQAELENLKIDKNTAMKNQEFDKVKRLNKNISDLELTMDNARVDHHQAMLKELTKEQQEKLAEMRPMKGMQTGKGMMHDDHQGVKKPMRK